jgi:hypothetical protein
MSVILEQLAQILAKAGISSSQEEEILTASHSLNTPPEMNEESTSEELEEDNEELQHDLSEGNYTYKIYIERWFPETTRLDSFNFSFNFVNLEFQQQISHAYTYFQSLVVKLKDNIFLLLLHAWIH